MNARFNAITAALALAGAAAQAGELGPGNHDGPGPVAMHVAAVQPANVFPVAQREPRPLRAASEDARVVEPVIHTPAAENPARDPASANWAMLLVGFLGAGAIARRRLSS
jgi:MYXO-CTERM domain-containing protein